MEFTFLMKHEPSNKPVKKKRFSWVLEENKYLSIGEVKVLRKECRKAMKEAVKNGRYIDVRNWFMLEFGLNTGLRVKEMSDLKIEDLMLSKDYPSIIVRNGKGGKKRVVKISSCFRETCLWFIRWKESIGQAISPDAYVLTAKRGRQLTKRALQKAFKRCALKARLEKHYSIHCLRHTYGSHLYLASGHNLRLVQLQLGHSSTKTTEVYASLMDSDVNIALEKLYKNRR